MDGSPPAELATEEGLTQGPRASPWKDRLASFRGTPISAHVALGRRKDSFHIDIKNPIPHTVLQ